MDWKIWLTALGAVGMAACPKPAEIVSLEFKTQENGIEVPVYSLEGAKVQELVNTKAGYRVTLAEVDRNNDKKTDLLVVEGWAPDGKLTNRVLIADDDLDGVLESIYADEFDHKTGRLIVDGIFDKKTGVKGAYKGIVGREVTDEDFKIENFIESLREMTRTQQ